MKSIPNPDRRGFLTCGAAGALAAGATVASPAAAPFEDPPFELAEATITDLADGMAKGKYTARKLVELYLARVEAIDRKGPTLRSVIEVNPDALNLADALDRERTQKGPRGPLHGVPILVKDNIDTADKMATTAGSLALVGAKPPADAFCITQLRKAGALILGKTNLSEWANARNIPSSTSGWSGRGGLTKNPYALDRNPCGSSSGSGVAPSANLCAAAVGTETDGSITCPSSVNGIVGIKPTVGLVSRTGIIPISHSQDTAGPMARTVRDAAILLGALAGADPEDNATADAPKSIPDYTKSLAADGLKGAKLAVARNFFGYHDRVDALAADALDVLKKQGAALTDATGLPKPDAYWPAEEVVFQYEMKAGINAYLARLGPDAPVKSLADVIAFNEKHRDKEMPYFGQQFFVKTQEKGPTTSYEYQEALAKCRRLARTEGLDKILDGGKFDAIVAPTFGPASVTDLVCGDRWLGGEIISVTAVAGYPHVTVPMGFVFGLPVGLSFVGRPWTEATLLRLAYAFEQATKHRRPPQFLATAKL
jgi:amidase